MSRGLVTTCSELGCYNVKPCAKHPKQQSPRSPETAERDRFYKSAVWLRLRTFFLGLPPEENPGIRCGGLCWECRDSGIVEPATDVDHIAPISDGGDKTALENLQSLCHSHHASKTRAEQLRKKAS